MSNRTDFTALVQELAEIYALPPACLERIETELHNAHVAGQEGTACLCRWCAPRALTAEELEMVSKYLRNKYGIDDGRGSL